MFEIAVAALFSPHVLPFMLQFKNEVCEVNDGLLYVGPYSAEMYHLLVIICFS